VEVSTSKDKQMSKCRFVCIAYKEYSLLQEFAYSQCDNELMNDDCSLRSRAVDACNPLSTRSLDGTNHPKISTERAAHEQMLARSP
jgi:hypothetical protein